MKFIRKAVLSVKEVYKQVCFNILPKGIFVGDIYEDDYNKEFVKILNCYFSLEEYFEEVEPIKKDMYLIKNDAGNLVPLNFLFCSDIEYKWLRVKKSFSIYDRQYEIGRICKFLISKHNKSLIYNGEIVRGYILDEILEEPTVIKTAILKCNFKSLKKGDECNVYSIIYIDKKIFYYIKCDNGYYIVSNRSFEDEKEYVYYIGEDTDMLKTGMKYELIPYNSIYSNKIKVNEDNSICVLKNDCITQNILDKLIEQNLIKEIR